MDYDVIVIGAGPGGYVAAISAAQHGKKTAIVEERFFGGVCLNEGCIPTKTLVKSVNLLHEIKAADSFGIEGVSPEVVKISMEKLQGRKNMVVKKLVDGVKGLLKGNGVEIIRGTASFVDANTIKVEDKTLTAENFIIATGSRAFMPPFIPLEGKTNVITSKEALDINYLPQSLAVIGGGVIGIEFAYIFASLGVKVTVIELLEQILPMVDGEVALMARKKLEKSGVVFKTGAKVKKVLDNSVIYEFGGNEEKLEAEAVLMAVGRVPNLEGLNIGSAGVALKGKAIETDAFLRTNKPNIYAIGDVNGVSMLAHTASHEGLVAVANICGHSEKMDYTKIPSCIYINPEIASIGLTEAQAKVKYSSVKVGKFPLVANGKALVEGETAGIIKVITDGEFGEILGVHIFGVHATDMIGEISVAMNLEATAEEIIHSVHPHPTVSEIIPEAFMSAVGKAIHSLK